MLKYIFSAILLIILFILNIFKNKISKNKLFILKTVIIVLLLETTIFNINSYRTDFGNIEQLNFSQKQISDMTNFTLDNTQYVSIDSIEKNVKSIYLELDNVDENQLIDYDIYYSDDSTSNRYLATKTYCQEVEKTKYSVISLSGNCKSIGINVKNDTVRISRDCFK